MFLIYVDSIKHVILPGVDMRVYAYVVKIFGEVGTPEGRERLVSTLKNFERWCQDLDLRLSAQKCVYMHFGRRHPQRQYRVNDHPLEAVTAVKDLGVLISNSLKYIAHVVDVGKGPRCG